jgi:NADH-quinone oxidoreductase subunit J
MMNPAEIAFFAAGAVAVIATILAITRTIAVHALLYLIVSLLAVAVVFYTMGAPLVAALEVIIYAGAIVVLFIFVVMMMNLGVQDSETERKWLAGRAWTGPVILSAMLLVEVIYLIVRAPVSATMSSIAAPKQIGLALYGPYLLGVELASMLLLGALVGACHLGQASRREARQ